MRYFIGVDESDTSFEVSVLDEDGHKVHGMGVERRADAMGEFGGWLNRLTAEGIDLLACLERPEGRLVEFLLDHGVVVYPVNPKLVERARGQYRVNPSNSDSFDAWVLADFLRKDHHRLRKLEPNSEEAAELKLLTRDRRRLGLQQTRCINQIIAVLKEYYRCPLDLFGDFSTQISQDFLKTFPTPESLEKLTWKRWQKFCKAHRRSQAQTQEMWEQIKTPRIAIKPHIVRTKSRMLLTLVEQLRVITKAMKDYDAEIQRFFETLPAVELAKSLPVGTTGVTVPMLWAELGDGSGRWASFRHLQAEAGSTPWTRRSGKARSVYFRYGCNKGLRYAIHWFSIHSIDKCDWAKAYYEAQRKRGKSYNQAIRALSSKWLKIIFFMWRDQVPYSEDYHLANITRQNLKHTLFT